MHSDKSQMPATHLRVLDRFELEQQLSFESLLALVSSRFVNIPARQVDREIEDSLRLICDSLEVDQSTIFLRDSEDPDVFVLSYVLRDPELSPPPKTKFTAAENFPWCNKKLIANEVICLPDIEEAPPEAAIDKAMWRKYGIYSALVIPLSTGGQRPFGFWGIDSTSNKRTWPEPLQQRLKILADVFANALERAEYEKQLRESEARLRLAANTTGAGFWTIDSKTGLIWATPKLHELFGLDPNIQLDLGLILSCIAMEDREAVKQAIDLMQCGREATVEYRINLPDGSIRWAMSRGNKQKFSQDRLALLAGITIDVTERHLNQEVMTSLSGRLIEAQEAERKRIARELHDGINQDVAMVALGIHQLHRSDDLPADERHKQIDQLLSDIKKIAADIQALSHELHSSSLDKMGLVAAIAIMCEELRKRHQVEVHFEHANVSKAIKPEIALAIFRITQEGLHNALKYSGVAEFNVHLEQNESYLQLTIRDSGSGFDVKSATKGRGLGLVSMRERVLALKGAFSIRSRLGYGTQLHVRVPCKVSQSEAVNQ